MIKLFQEMIILHNLLYIFLILFKGKNYEL